MHTIFFGKYSSDKKYPIILIFIHFGIFLFTFSFFTQRTAHMINRHDRPAIKHSWRSIAHHLLNLLSLLRRITMYPAITAKGFLRHKRTMIGTHFYIGSQGPAGIAQTIGSSLVFVAFTIYGDHLPNHFFFQFSFFLNLLCTLSFHLLPPFPSQTISKYHCLFLSRTSCFHPNLGIPQIFNTPILFFQTKTDRKPQHCNFLSALIQIAYQTNPHHLLIRHVLVFFGKSISAVRLIIIQS